MRRIHVAYDRLDDVTARIGADDIEFFESPRPDLLREITGLEPEPSGVHVLLENQSVRSTQRVALGDVGGDVVVAIWPAELKRQAEYLYAEGRGQAMVAAARSRGWDVWPSPRLAFFTSAPEQRLYMAPALSAEDYCIRWEGPDGRRIGRYPATELRTAIWPWLKERGYADATDDAVFQEFLHILKRRKGDLRPGMRFRRRWPRKDRERIATADFAARVRTDVNAILGAAGETTLLRPLTG
jgi:hypothetical protein